MTHRQEVNNEQSVWLQLKITILLSKEILNDFVQRRLQNVFGTRHEG